MHMVCMHAGADREPELLQDVFSCVATICKTLVKHLAADLPLVRCLSSPRLA